MRSLAVLAFIAIVAAAALYVSQRATVARGEVVAAELLQSNAKVLSKIDCDAAIPLGVDGASFWCRAEFKHGAVKRLHMNLDRTGRIKQIGEQAEERPGGPPSAPAVPIDKSDPWR